MGLSKEPLVIPYAQALKKELLERTLARGYATNTANTPLFSSGSFYDMKEGTLEDSQIEAIRAAFQEPIEVERTSLSRGSDEIVTLIFGSGERARYTKSKWRGKDTELIKRIADKTGRTPEWRGVDEWNKYFQWNNKYYQMKIEDLEKSVNERSARMKRPARVDLGVGK